MLSFFSFTLPLCSSFFFCLSSQEKLPFSAYRQRGHRVTSQSLSYFQSAVVLGVSPCFIAIFSATVGTRTPEERNFTLLAKTSAPCLHSDRRESNQAARFTSSASMAAPLPFIQRTTCPIVQQGSASAGVRVGTAFLGLLAAPPTTRQQPRGGFSQRSRCSIQPQICLQGTGGPLSPTTH